MAALQQAAVYVEIPNVERAQLPGWIGTRLASQNQSADRQSLDFIGRISFVTVDVKGPGFRVDDNGYSLNASLRTRVLGQLELSGGFNYQDLNRGGEDTSINIGARDYLQSNVALGLDILQNNGDTTAIIGARYDFK